MATTSPTASQDATEKAKQTAHDAKQAAREAVDDAQDEAKSRAADAKSQATDALSDVAGALHDTSDAFRDRDRDAFARYAETAASQVDEFTRSIRNRNVGELLDEAERFARREPGLFIGGAFLLGVVGARFLKASAPTGGASGSRSSRNRSGDWSGTARSASRPYGAYEPGTGRMGDSYRGERESGRLGTEAGTLGTGSRSGSIGGGAMMASGAAGTAPSVSDAGDRVADSAPSDRTGQQTGTGPR